MSTSIRTAVRLALRARLATVPGLPPVAFELQFPVYVPVLGTLYVREALLYGPGSTQPITTGPVVTKSLRGIYQLTIKVPMQKATALGTAIKAAEGLADKLCDHFAVGTVLTYDSRRVVIESASAPSLVPEPPDWASLPVSIAVFSDFTTHL